MVRLRAGAFHRTGDEDATNRYRRWRLNLGYGQVTDIDQVEYGYRNGRQVYAAVLELKYDLPHREGWREECIEKVLGHPPGTLERRGEAILSAARNWACDAWLVIYSDEIDWFSVFNLSQEDAHRRNRSDDVFIPSAEWWGPMDRARYGEWLGWLRWLRRIDIPAIQPHFEEKRKAGIRAMNRIYNLCESGGITAATFR